jgi:hypothetical protein
MIGDAFDVDGTEAVRAELGSRWVVHARGLAVSVCGRQSAFSCMHLGPMGVWCPVDLHRGLPPEPIARVGCAPARSR